jgi:hypothetical protein
MIESIKYVDIQISNSLYFFIKYVNIQLSRIVIKYVDIQLIIKFFLK